MKTLQVNFFEYEGKPFAEGLLSAAYHPTQRIIEDRKYVIGMASKTVQGFAGKSSTVVQFGDRIYCVTKNPKALKKSFQIETKGQLFEWTLVEEDKILLPHSKESREVLRRLAAKAIADQQIDRGWFVERFRLVYHWSFNLTERLSMEFMDVFPGFVFRPYIYKDGSCAVLIDPKFKFIPRRTLRDTIDELVSRGLGRKEIGLIFENERVIDACPIFDCNFRRDPNSICRLKGAGRGKVLAKLDFSKRPSRASFGNLVKYHMRRNICPNEGRLGRYIADKPPLALLDAPRTGELLEYPLERLREELKLHNLSKVSRLFAMKYIQPPMSERWILTKSFIGYVDGINIGSLITLRLIRRFAEAGSHGKPWANYDYFDEIPLQIARSHQTHQPFIGLEKYGPYDLSGSRRGFKELSVSLYNFSTKVGKRELQKFYNALVKGFSYRPGFLGLERLFKIHLPEFSEDLIRTGLPARHLLVTKNRPHVVIVIAPRLGHEKVKQYGYFKRELTLRGIPSQFVLDDNIDPRTPAAHYSSYLKNVALGIYYKAGGTPWALSRPAATETCFLGLDTVTRQGKTFFSLQIFNPYGVWLGGWTDFVRRKDYPTILEKKLDSAVQIYEEQEKRPGRIVIHKEGEIWRSTELNPAKDALGPNCEIIAIKKLGVPRMYNTGTRKDYIVGRGACVQIDADTALLATSGPPHPIRGSQRFLTVQIYNPEVNEGMLMRTSREIFELSLVYGGYSLAVTSRPVTTHFANAATNLAAKYRIRDNPKIWRQAWFV